MARVQSENASDGLQMASSNVVIVSADPKAQQALASLLDKSGLASIPASTVKETESILSQDLISVILCSEELPDGGFRDVLRQTTKAMNRVPVVVLSRLADWERYLSVLKGGAFDCVLYPSSAGEIERVVRNALDCSRREKAEKVAPAA